jgi:IS30 family transposase
VSSQGSSAEAKARFFASFDRTGSVTISAAELGLNRGTCARWASAAGLRSNRRRDGHPRRAEYDRLRAAGASRGRLPRLSG